MLSRRLALSTGALTIAGVISASGPAPAVAAPRDATGSFAGCTGSSSTVAGSTSTRTISVNGVQRSFRVHLPARYQPSRATPLIVAFHGRGENAAAFQRYTGISRLPAITVFPEGLRSATGPRSWQSAPYANPKADDVAFTRAILRTLRTQACVDSSRIFAVGRSNGGGLANLLACRLPGQFAAIAMVSGAFYPQAQRGCLRAQPVSRMEVHGTKDAIVPYDGARKFGAALPAIPSTVDGWARRADCEKPIERKIRANVTQTDWMLCRPLGVMISHVRIDGGGHNWPGSTTAGLIWRFFQMQRPALFGS